MEAAAFMMEDVPDPFCISLGISNCLGLIKFLNTILLVDVPDADLYLFVAFCLLALLAVAQQFDVFTRPPPVPIKELPRRPALQVIFKPDDVIGTATAAVASSVANEQQETSSIADEISIFTEDEGSLWTTEKKDGSTQRSSAFTGSKPTQKKIYKKTQQPRKTNVQHQGLPDSFAPLLSSSEMEVLWDGLTADLIHAVQVQAQVRLREGRHTIPLDKDDMRPQFWFDSSGSDIFSAQNETTKKGCKISANFIVGSERMTLDEDLDTSKHISERSQPMVKSGDLIFDPPLRLGNVAPTLLHFPQLFEDKAMPRLRRMQIVGFVIEFLASLWFLLEKILWMIERRCQVHLSKVKVAPIYRRQAAVGEAQWRLSLSFTGHLLMFDFLPIPFISFHLPTFVIPQPHALLEYLLTAQPLASAKLHRENIAEERISVAALSAVDSFSSSVKAVVTPPAVEMDLTLAGGLTLSFEMMHGLDVTNNNRMMKRESTPPTLLNIPKQNSSNTLHSWFNSGQSNTDSSRLKHQHISVPGPARLPSQLFDANSMSPWYFETAVDGSLSTEKIVINVSRCMGRHQDESSSFPSRSTFSVSGSVVVCRAQSDTAVLNRRPASGPPLLKRNLSKNTANALPPIHALLMFPDTYVPSSKRTSDHLVEYDYAFDVGEETQLDTVSLSYGASHPMLKGGTIVSCMLESIYAYGSIHAREGAVVDPSEKLRKRNILRHLPAVDFTAGVENMFIPKSSISYLDDGNTRSIPEMDGGRLMIRVLGGLDESMLNSNVSSPQIIVKEGIKVIADFGVTTFSSKNESKLNEFPELDIFDKLCSSILGTCDGSITCHLRPQRLLSSTSSSGPNVFNPLEAYEIDFSGSKVSLRLKEANFNLGHRRVIVPTETTFAVKVLKSVVNMGFEGTTKCELAWDFQGTSPILQATAPGQTIAQTSHEDRKQAPLLIKDLCQGRLNLDVSSVGGISFTQASTSRENKEGLYDWKFFNALVSPDDDSPARIMDVLHDKKTMNRLLAVTKLINADLEKIASYALTKVWRAKEIFDQEGVSDPGHAIPGHRMARLMSLFLCGDVSQVDEILPIIRRVVAGNGLDVVKVKELVRKHVNAYDDWAAEIDRGVKWAAVMLGPMTVPSPFVETEVPPLTECIDSKRYAGIPTAKSLYDTLQDKPKLPLDPSFSNLVSRIAPYMTFRQVSYVLNSRPASHWQPFDLKRIRYVYSVKKKVEEISESYGGLSFMPQSFFVSVFLGEATRSSLRAATATDDNKNNSETEMKVGNRSALAKLRHQRFGPGSPKYDSEGFIMSPAGRIASMNDFSKYRSNPNLLNSASDVSDDLLGDSLLGPQDIAVLLQAGLTSAIKGSTVVQLNQRMLLDLMASQPASFAIGVLAELGVDGPRQLANALMALCDLDQGSFKEAHRIDIHALLEMWLPGLKIPRRDDYLAGGRWARQSFYDAIYSVAISILDLSETYNGLKLRIQQVRHNNERDPLPVPLELLSDFNDQPTSKLMSAIKEAVTKISIADDLAQNAFDDLRSSGSSTKESDLCATACQAYRDAFAACAQVISIDKLAFQSDWFKSFFRRNYDALMVKSIYDNIIDDVDSVRVWMEALRRGSMGITPSESENLNNSLDSTKYFKPFFTCPEEQKEQELIDGIIDALFFDKKELECIKNDPLVRMLIGNDPGHYNFTIITAMGVVTEGKQGTELHTAIERLEKERGVVTIRADTGTARSIDYNANKIEEAVNAAMELKRPYGLVGYSQGCANEMNFESMMISGTPDQQKVITGDNGLVCRQLLFSAANGSMHGPATEAKVHQLITMCEDFLKYQQGYFSRAFISTTIDVLNSGLDSSAFQKFLGGTKSFLPYASRTFWREAQHLPHIPTCVIRGVLEPHTTPESLDMLSNTLTKQSGSALHDSQVHVYDAVGHPVYFKNRNGRILKSTDMGGAVQRTHHWSPLSEEVEYVRTDRDVEQGVFDCAKDRHIFPFCDVNARFGIIKYADVKN